MTLVRMCHGSKNMSIGRSCNSKCNTGQVTQELDGYLLELGCHGGLVVM